MTTWDNFKKRKRYPELEKDASAEVVIVGGGITGLLSAYVLSKAGKKVILLEKGDLCFGATGATTAFITKVIDTNLSELVSLFGTDTARAVLESGQRAVEEFEKIIEAEDIECEFMRCSNWLYASTKKQVEDIKAEAKAYRALGIRASFRKPEDLPDFRNYGSLEISSQAKFHVTKFCYALAEKAAANGARIYEHTPVRAIKGHVVLLSNDHAEIAADDIVIATYKPITNKRTHLKKGMYRSFIFEVDVPAGEFAEGIYEDAGNPYYYFRIDRQKGAMTDRMIIGGEDHKDMFGNALVNRSFKSLEKYLGRLMRNRPYKIVKKWYGPILEPSDGLPLIGALRPHLYVASAFSGNGMTYSMIAALMFRDLIFGRQNAWSGVYDPTRTIVRPKRLARKALDYTEEFFQGAVKNLLSR